MATPTPFNLARPQLPTIQKVEHHKRDLYNFSYVSTSQGTINPPVWIPTMGPHAAGATPPNKFPQVDYVEVLVDGSSTAPSYLQFPNVLPPPI